MGSLFSRFFGRKSKEDSSVKTDASEQSSMPSSNLPTTSEKPTEVPAVKPSFVEMPADELKTQIITVIETVYDPEIPVNIYELGLIYEINIDQNSDVDVVMTLTSPNCPVAESLPKEVEDKIRILAGVRSMKLNLVFEPPWSMDKMSEAAKLELGMM